MRLDNCAFADAECGDVWGEFNALDRAAGRERSAYMYLVEADLASILASIYHCFTNSNNLSALEHLSCFACQVRTFRFEFIPFYTQMNSLATLLFY